MLIIYCIINGRASCVFPLLYFFPVCVLQMFAFPGDLQLRMATMTPEDYTQFETAPG